MSPKSDKPRKPNKPTPAQLARRASAAAAKRARVRRRWAVASAVLVATLVLGVVAVTVGGGDDSTEVDTSTDATRATITTVAGESGPAPVPAGLAITGDTPCPSADGSSPRTSMFAKAPPPDCTDSSRKYVAVFDTTEGRIEVALDAAGVPATVNNFVVLSRYHYYDGSAIHRTDPSIDIIQGGAPTTQNASDPGPGYTITDEGTTDRSYTEGDLVMARTGSPNSAGAQFFFVAGPNASALDSQGTYVTFGKVTAGLDVVKSILGLHQAGGQLGGAPSRPVIVNSVTITEA